MRSVAGMAHEATSRRPGPVAGARAAVRAGARARASESLRVAWRALLLDPAGDPGRGGLRRALVGRAGCGAAQRASGSTCRRSPAARRLRRRGRLAARPLGRRLVPGHRRPRLRRRRLAAGRVLPALPAAHPRRRPSWAAVARRAADRRLRGVARGVPGGAGAALPARGARARAPRCRRRRCCCSACSRRRCSWARRTRRACSCSARSAPSTRRAPAAGRGPAPPRRRASATRSAGLLLLLPLVLIYFYGPSADGPGRGRARAAGRALRPRTRSAPTSRGWRSPRGAGRLRGLPRPRLRRRRWRSLASRSSGAGVRRAARSASGTARGAAVRRRPPAAVGQPRAPSTSSRPGGDPFRVAAQNLDAVRLPLLRAGGRRRGAAPAAVRLRRSTWSRR